MKKGPSPKPTNLKVLEGNPGKRPLSLNEPQPKPALPLCPNFLKGAAKKEWQRLSPELYTLGLLSLIDRAALAAYCSAYGMWVEVEHELMQMRKSNKELAMLKKKYPERNIQSANGLVRQTSNGNWIMEPLLGVRKQALEQMHKFLTEFGMTPASRTRIMVDISNLNHGDDKMEEVLNRGRQN